ncbi:Glycerophosphoryl diester phosphodiesterase family protein [compost metagenome]
MAKLNFKPDIYSPHYGLVDQALKDSLKTLKMRLIPWTVNEEKDIDRMIELHVDGIITDYPERVLKKL